MVAVVGLVLFGTLMAPSRTALLVSLLLLLVPVALARREAVLPALLILLPFYTLVRRLFLLRDPTVLNLDPLILLPDLLTLIAGVHLLFGRCAPDARRPTPDAWPGEPQLPGVTARLRPSASGVFPAQRAIDHCPLDARGPRQASGVKSCLVDYLVLALLALVALALVVGTRHGLPTALNGARMFGLYILIYFYTRFTVRRWEKVGEILLITLFAGLVTGVYGVYQTLIGLPSYDRLYFENTPARMHVIGGFVRAFSTFQFTVHFSIFMLLVFFCALTLCQQRAGRIVRLVSVVTLAASVLGIAVTFVRSTWVGLAAGLAAYVLLRWVRHPVLRWAAVLVLVPVACFSLGALSHETGPVGATTEDSPTVALRGRAYSVLSATPDTDLYGRYLGLQEALRIAASGPLGYGLGATSAERFGVGTVAWTGDSQVTTLLVELGWPGLLCFFGILLLALRANIRAIDTAPSRDLRLLLIGIACMQVGLLVACLTGGPLWYTQPTSVYGWMLAALAVNAGER
jgi:hypothetical protein